MKLTPIKDQIELRGWENFVRRPPLPVTSIVLEFSANGAYKNDDGIMCAWVRKKSIELTLEAITKAAGLPPWPEDDMANHSRCFYTKNWKKPNWSEVFHTICKPDAECLRVRAPDSLDKFSRANLKLVAKFWNLFVTNRLIPTLNENFIDRERAFVIYCIMTGKLFDPAVVIRDTLLIFLKHIGDKNIQFPCLMTELARQARVKIERGEMKASSQKRDFYDGSIPGLLKSLTPPTDADAGPSHEPEAEQEADHETEYEAPPPPQPPMMAGDITHMLQMMQLDQNRVNEQMLQYQQQMLQSQQLMELEQRRAHEQTLRSQQVMYTNQTRAYEHMIQMQQQMWQHMDQTARIPPMPQFELFDFGGASGYGRGPGEGGSRAPSCTEVVGGDGDNLPADLGDGTEHIDED